MSFYRQDDCENWKWSKVSKSVPSKPVKETDVSGFVYTNKPDEVTKNEQTAILLKEECK